MRRFLVVAMFMLVVVLLPGCGGSHASGKNNNQDKPKPVEPE